VLEAFRHGSEYLGLGELLLELVHGLRERIGVVIFEIVRAGCPRLHQLAPTLMVAYL
jgi:hypothetical protein